MEKMKNTALGDIFAVATKPAPTQLGGGTSTLAIGQLFAFLLPSHAELQRYFTQAMWGLDHFLFRLSNPTAICFIWSSTCQTKTVALTTDHLAVVA